VSCGGLLYIHRRQLFAFGSEAVVDHQNHPGSAIRRTAAVRLERSLITVDDQKGTQRIGSFPAFLEPIAATLYADRIGYWLNMRV
jgi:hypothetical protein